MPRRVLRFMYLLLVHRVWRRLSSLPTEAAKAQTVILYGQSTPTLIETGTYQGNTVAMCLGQSEVPAPVLFWLDAHYSDGETAKGPHDPPLPWELRAILERGDPDVLLIDDARLMGLLPDYPSVDEIRQLVGERASSFEVKNDIIRITLRSNGSEEGTHPEPLAGSRG
jgi:hypothetical protein